MSARSFWDSQADHIDPRELKHHPRKLGKGGRSCMDERAGASSGKRGGEDRSNLFEPRRVRRRLGALSQAAMAACSCFVPPALFGLGQRDVADRLEEPSVVEPIDPFERGKLDGLKVAPRPASVDHLGFVEAVDRLGESVVVGIADTTDRGKDAGLGEAFGVADRDVLDASVAVVNQAVGSAGSTRVECLLQGNRARRSRVLSYSLASRRYDGRRHR